MTATASTIASLHTLALQGDWDEVLSAWNADPALAMACSRHRAADSGRAFLHAAAQHGNEAACREMIRWGSDAAMTDNDGNDAAALATAAGHSELAALLKRVSATSDSLWAPPTTPTLRPSSGLWHEASERKAESTFNVAYGGGTVTIHAGERYFVDSFERPLIGWHGSYDPPCGMDGDTML